MRKQPDCGNWRQPFKSKGEQLKVAVVRYVTSPDADARRARAISILLAAAKEDPEPTNESTNPEKPHDVDEGKIE